MVRIYNGKWKQVTKVMSWVVEWLGFGPLGVNLMNHSGKLQFISEAQVKGHGTNRKLP